MLRLSPPPGCCFRGFGACSGLVVATATIGMLHNSAAFPHIERPFWEAEAQRVRFAIVVRLIGEARV